MLALTRGSINKQDQQKGQTLVEFALVTVIFFVVLFGIIEFSRALWTYNTIVQATRAGARFAVVEVPTASDIEVQRFVAYHNSTGSGTPVVPGLGTSNVSVNYWKINPLTGAYEAPTPNKYAADVIQVGITGYTFSFLVPIFGLPSHCLASPPRYSWKASAQARSN